MRVDAKLSNVLHVLLHMAEAEGPMTSEQMARAMQSNPVVARRVMAGLRQARIVRSEKGHGGGWSLIRRLDQISLAEVYAALGAPRLLAIGHRSETPKCLVEQAVNAALDEAFQEAEARLLGHMERVTLAALRDDFHERLSDCKGTLPGA